MIYIYTHILVNHNSKHCVSDALNVKIIETVQKCHTCVALLRWPC